ncbi:type VI secretion system protein TssA [uncultured Desulfobacter sp.]|uniref:type VI secretion system protein TssA n=1 Tax=uncultured Desulfobacter sp. TaxID=240139 RepID=UPI002AAB02AD|nr:type VI secretion system protein TssA [uncultured Desulfobacter sp.]
MQLETLGTSPISEDAPAGKDVRYEPDFEALSAEIAKLGSPTAVSAVDWDIVIDLSSRILETQSKHLQVAAYLNYGLIKKSGWDGLSQGVHIFKELLEHFWPTLFPPQKRMKGRVGIVVWWVEKISAYLDGAQGVVWNTEKRSSLMGDLDAIDRFLSENVDDAPLLLPMIRKVSDLIEEDAPVQPEPEPQPDPEPESAPQPEPEPGSRPEPEGPAAPAPVDGPVKPVRAVTPPPSPSPGARAVQETATDPEDLLDQGLDCLGRAANGFRGENIYNPVPYRLSRISAWTDINELPPATGGKTLIEPPDSDIIAGIRSLYDAGSWADLAESCEDKVRQFLFWLDLSRYVSESMEKLGAAQVSRTIDAETRVFVQNLKGIETLAFADGTPFADNATREWIRQISEGPGTASRQTAPGADETRVDVGQAVDQATALIRENKLDEALSLFKASLSRAGSTHEKFLWKTGLLRVLVGSKQTRIAAVYACDILEIIDRYSLDDWEPHLSVEAMSLALTSLRLEEKDENDALIQGLIKRVSLLDPVQALTLV